jgi:hypothetical protein
MKLTIATVTALLIVAASTTVDSLSEQGLSDLEARFATNRHTNATCTLENAAIRQEWLVFFLSSLGPNS